VQSSLLGTTGGMSWTIENVPGEGTYRFLCTGDVPSFREHGSRFLQMPLGEVEHVDFEAPSTATLNA